jgi:S1-C subfamily serine protease
MMIRWTIGLLFPVWVLSASGSTPARMTPVVQAVGKALPSVVNIGTEKLVKVVHKDPFQQIRSQLFHQHQKDLLGPVLPPASVGYKVKHSLGSGVVVDPAGYIITNYHVV